MVSNLRDVLRSRRGRWRALLDYISTQGGGGGELSDGSVTTAKIADGAVTTDKIADGAVNADKIENGTITYDKIKIDIFSITLINNETTGSVILPPYYEPPLEPVVISCIPLEGNTGYVKNYGLDLIMHDGKETWKVDIEVSQAPGQNQTAVYQVVLMFFIDENL